MRTLKVLTLFLLFSQVVLAQDFAPVGSTWYYSYSNFYPFSSFYSLEYYKIESLKDTLIQGNTCKKLSVVHYHSGGGSTLLAYEYVYTDGDIVYRLAQNDVFYVLYNFGAQVGDKWTVRSSTIAYPNEIEAEIEVISVGTTIINEKTLRQLFVRSNNQELGFSIIDGSGNDYAIITETLGGNYMFPDNDTIVDIVIVEGLRCYDDTDFGHYTSNLSTTCDYIYTATEKQTEANTLQLYPNPTSQNITLVSPFTNQAQEIYIYTLDGRLVSTYTISSDEITINLESLEKGTYLLKIQAEGKETWVKKVVKL